MRISGTTTARRLLASYYEKLAHEATLSEFWIGKTEIINEQYRRFRVDQTGEDKLSATSVSWDDTKTTCEFFGGRLPRPPRLALILGRPRSLC